MIEHYAVLKPARLRVATRKGRVLWFQLDGGPRRLMNAETALELGELLAHQAHHQGSSATAPEAILPNASPAAPTAAVSSTHRASSRRRLIDAASHGAPGSQPQHRTGAPHRTER